MKKFIEHLRAKPEKERKHILHIATFVSAFLLVVLWTFTLHESFTDPDLKTQTQEELKPFGELKANVLDGFNVISDDTSSSLQE
jgi:hypothetical protein